MHLEKMKALMPLGDWVKKEHGKVAGVFLTHLADRAGLSRGHFWRLLETEHTTTLEVVAKIAGVLDVDALDLLDEDRPLPPAAAQGVRRRRIGARTRKG